MQPVKIPRLSHLSALPPKKADITFELTDEAEFGVHLHWCRQCRTRPCHSVFLDLIEKPRMKTACQHPFDPITTPKNSLLFNVSFLHRHDIIPSTLQVSRTDRQGPHFLEPTPNIGVISRREFNLHCLRTRDMWKQRNVSDR